MYKQDVRLPRTKPIRALNMTSFQLIIRVTRQIGATFFEVLDRHRRKSHDVQGLIM
jgi:hypothetical protein